MCSYIHKKVLPTTCRCTYMTHSTMFIHSSPHNVAGARMRECRVCVCGGRGGGGGGGCINTYRLEITKITFLNPLEWPKKKKVMKKIERCLIKACNMKIYDEGWSIPKQSNIAYYVRWKWYVSAVIVIKWSRYMKTYLTFYLKFRLKFCLKVRLKLKDELYVMIVNL